MRVEAKDSALSGANGAASSSRCDWHACIPVSATRVSAPRASPDKQETPANARGALESFPDPTLTKLTTDTMARPTVPARCTNGSIAGALQLSLARHCRRVKARKPPPAPFENKGGLATPQKEKACSEAIWRDVTRWLIRGVSSSSLTIMPCNNGDVESIRSPDSRRSTDATSSSSSSSSR